MTIDIRASSYKNKVGLYVSKDIDGNVFAKSGIKAKPDRSVTCTGGFHYTITIPAARKLIDIFGAEVTSYGKPIEA